MSYNLLATAYEIAQLQNFMSLFAIFLFVSLVISIILTIFAVKIANGHGRDSVAWGLLVFFFGLIPFIILLATNKNATQNTNITTQNGWICNKCGQINHYFTKQCTYCGLIRPEEKITPEVKIPSTETIAYKGIWVCPKCGAKNGNSLTKCINCRRKRP